MTDIFKKIKEFLFGEDFVAVIPRTYVLTIHFEDGLARREVALTGRHTDDGKLVEVIYVSGSSKGTTYFVDPSDMTGIVND